MKKVFSLISLFFALSNLFAAKKVFKLEGYVPFPEEADVIYIDDIDELLKNYNVNCSLENYLAYNESVNVCPLNTCKMSAVKESFDTVGTKDFPAELIDYDKDVVFTLGKVVGYGIKNNTFFYIYTASENKGGFSRSGIIRGCDITRAYAPDSYAYRATKAGVYSIAYQKCIQLNDEELRGTFRNLINNFKSYLRYEVAESFIYNVQFFHGKNCMDLDLNFPGNWITLYYPSNMNNPVPIIMETRFSGGMGGGAYNHYLYSVEEEGNYAYADEICNYCYCDTDGGPVGFGFFYFTKNGFGTYAYETEGNYVNKNEWCTYRQNPSNPFEFSLVSRRKGEPVPTSKSDLKVGMKVNAVCNLKLRSSEGLSSSKLATIPGGTMFLIKQVGASEKIDGVTAPWIYVEIIDFKEKPDETTGWVFSGYVE